MSIEDDVLGFPIAPKPARQWSNAGVTALSEAASRLADARRGAPRFKTRDLVALLLTHGARTWRNSLPEVAVRLRVTDPAGRAVVRLRLGA